MKEFQKRFIIQLFIISLGLYGVLFVLSTHIALNPLLPVAMVALLFAVNSLAFIIVTNTKEKNPRGFVYSYMAMSFGRMIICTVFIFSYALTHRQGARTFALTFFILYFLYTIWEVRALYTFFKN